MGRVRLRVAVFAFLLLPAGIGVIAAHAAPDAAPACARLVKTYITVPVRNRVAKATAIAWAKWRIGHPDWRPNARASRPKYIMTTKEVMDKIAFACAVERAHDAGKGIFAGEDDDLPPAIGGPLMGTAMGAPDIPLPDPFLPRVAEEAATEDTLSSAGDYLASEGMSGFNQYAGVGGGGFGGFGSFGGASSFTQTSQSTPPISLDVPITPAPEPASLMLVGLGVVAGLVVRGRRMAPVGQA